jgi:hypothetical protein
MQKGKIMMNYKKKSVHLLESCAAEDNSIVRNWQEMRFTATSAYQNTSPYTATKTVLSDKKMFVLSIWT